DTNPDLSVLLGNSDGTFGTPTTYGFTYYGYQLATADLNADGKPDLVLGNYNGAVTVAYNKGDGSFSGINYGIAGNPTGVAVGDFTNDGRPDLIVANRNSTALLLTGDTPIALLSEDPAGSGIRSGYARGNLSSTSDADFFSFTAHAGDWLTLATEVPGNPGAIQLHYTFFDPAGNALQD